MYMKRNGFPSRDSTMAFIPAIAQVWHTRTTSSHGSTCAFAGVMATVLHSLNQSPIRQLPNPIASNKSVWR